jgi:hypothetical protein
LGYKIVSQLKYLFQLGYKFRPDARAELELAAANKKAPPDSGGAVLGGEGKT